MRAIDDDTPMWVAILQKLRQWGPLPESDIGRMIKPFIVVTDDLRDMAEEGYIEMAFSGDEYVITDTQLGRLFLEQEENASEDEVEKAEEEDR